MATDKTLSKLIINNLTQAQYDSATKNEDELYLTPDTTDDDLAKKQDKLVSGTNIKTINNESILGSGNISISGGGGDSAVGTITLTDAQAYEFSNNNQITLTDDEVTLMKNSAYIKLVYNDVVQATLTTNILYSSTFSKSIYTFSDIVYTGFVPTSIVVFYFSSDNVIKAKQEGYLTLDVANMMMVNNHSLYTADSGQNVQFYVHNILMSYETSSATFQVRFQITNNVSNEYTSLSALTGYLGTSFVQGCTGFANNGTYGQAYSVTPSKVYAIIGNAQATIDYTTTGLTITDTIKEMS